MADKNTIPIEVLHLFPPLERKLIELLKSLTPEEWQAQTIAKRWKVKDVAGHLLDGNIRPLSMLRDNYFGEQATIKSYQDLVDYLNNLNADWVKAMKRVSPTMLIFLHELTEPLYYDYYRSLDPFGKSGFAVNWAGEEESKNWMHIAREYTEKWLHQQQIRDAVNKPGILTKEFFYPFIDTFMMALPYTYRDIAEEDGTVIKLTVSGEMGGAWFLVRANSKWILDKSFNATPAAEVILDPDTSWKLFSKSWRTENVKDKVTLLGNKELGEVALKMVSVMA